MILLVDNRSSQLIYNVGIFTKFIAEKMPSEETES
jgi:hypothetical protein